MKIIDIYTLNKVLLVNVIWLVMWLLKKAEREAIRSLKNDNDLFMIKADKGNATVLVNREDYVGRMDELLKGEDYVRIRKKPTSVLEKKVKDALSKIEKNGILPISLKKRLTPQESKCPQMYGLPKVYKLVYHSDQMSVQ